MTRVTRYQGAIVQNHHILLIMHRDYDTGRTYWVIPGGGREPGETEETCVIREMREETNLVVKVIRLLYREPAPVESVYQWRKTYLCSPISGTAAPGYEPEFAPNQGYEIAAVNWFDLRDERSWGSTVTKDLYTYPQLQQIRALLSPTNTGSVP